MSKLIPGRVRNEGIHFYEKDLVSILVACFKKEVIVLI